MLTALVLVPFLAFALLFAGIIAYIYWWNAHGGGKRNRELAAEESKRRATRLQMNGWRYDDKSDGDIRYRIRGTTANGHEWLVEYDSDHSSSSSTPKLTYRATLAGEREWEIVDRWSYNITRKGVGGAMVGGLTKMLSAMSKDFAKHAEFHANASELTTPSAAFRERYVFVALDNRHGDLIDTEIERAILEWPQFKQSMSKRDNCFMATLEPAGLRVQLHVDGPGVEVIEHLIGLGNKLLEKAVAMRAGSAH